MESDKHPAERKKRKTKSKRNPVKYGVWIVEVLVTLTIVTTIILFLRLNAMTAHLIPDPKLVTMQQSNSNHSISSLSSSAETDTKRLTAEQVEKWALRNYLSDIGDETSKRYTAVSNMGNDALVYISITRQEKVVALYRVNADGGLELSMEENHEEQWLLVSTKYEE